MATETSVRFTISPGLVWSNFPSLSLSTAVFYFRNDPIWFARSIKELSETVQHRSIIFHATIMLITSRCKINRIKVFAKIMDKMWRRASIFASEYRGTRGCWESLVDVDMHRFAFTRWVWDAFFSFHLQTIDAVITGLGAGSREDIRALSQSDNSPCWLAGWLVHSLTCLASRVPLGLSYHIILCPT